LDCKVQKREFVTHTGWIGNKRITVISTGIGTGNIDIVLNELDALFNIDLKEKKIKSDLTQLDIIRIGTSGYLNGAIPLNTFLVSEFAVGMDNLSTKDTKLHKVPHVFQCSTGLLNQLGKNIMQGITLTCPGFYGPQVKKPTY